MSYEERRILEMRTEYIEKLFTMYENGEISLDSFKDEARQTKTAVLKIVNKVT